MKDVIQWALISLLVLFAVTVGADKIGIDLDGAIASVLSFLQTIGILLLIFTGSAAAIEVAKYFRKKSLALENGPSAATSALSESELERTLTRAVGEVMTPLREDVGEMRVKLEQEREKKKLPDSRFEQREKRL